MNLTAFSRLSTGVKMLLLMSVALLPLGLIAVLASVENAQTTRLKRAEDARMLAADAARQLNAVIGRASLSLRAAVARLDSAPAQMPELRARCTVILRDLQAIQRVPVGFALYTTAGRRVCATPGFSLAPSSVPRQLFTTDLRVLPAQRLLRFEARSGGGMLMGVGELSGDILARIVEPPVTSIGHAITLRQGDARLALSPPDALGTFGRELTVMAPVASGQASLEVATNAIPITAIEIVLALLPILMWLAAAIIGWLVVDRLLIRPLLRLQQVLADYRPSDGPLVIPQLTTPAQEIRDLGQAFQTLTTRLLHHDAELAEGLARQTKLTREVHHRVKNNLQVVASLINIHSRGVQDPAVAAAYASIQRRVDALAVVHRNHYAELEAHHGVSLRALIAELASNLRATAEPSAASLAITLDLIPAFVVQDVAVPVAFLITEVVELAMLCDPRGHVAIRLEPVERPDRALLSVCAPGLAKTLDCGAANRERFRRVVEGLARQVRAKLDVDEAAGRYAIEVPIETVLDDE